MIKFLQFLLVLVTFFYSSAALSKGRFFSIEIKAKENGYLNEILQDSTQIPKKFLKMPGFLKMVKRYNPKLRKKNRVKKGEKIYIELPYKTALKIARMEKEVKIGKNFVEQQDFGYSLSYSLSKKNISDTSSTSSVDSTQNSPYTIGVSVNKRFNEEYSYFGTAFVSKMNNSFAPNDQPVAVPLEMAMKNYIQKKFDSHPYLVYGGLDIERFSTFKSTSFTEVARLQHSFAFLTVGIARPFSLFNRGMLFKISFAQSIWNKLDLQSTNNVTFETFSGNKLASLFIISVTKRLGIHFFYDWHMLEAESKLNISRFGSGVHFRF
jgi:hypothetical protein